MSALQPDNTTLGDVVSSSLTECGRVGDGQTPSSGDTQKAWARLQWMVQEWERKRFLVYHLVDLAVTSTGAQFYTIGPGGDIDTGGPGTVRPDKLEAAFLRQLTQSQPNQIDYPLEILQSYEDYARIALKQLQSFPSAIFLDAGWPLGKLYPWPVPQANIYAVHVIVKAQLPSSLSAAATKFSLPYEYYSCMMYNLAWRLRSTFQIPTFPGDSLPGMAKNSYNVLRGANSQIARLQLPDLGRRGQYNIFSDRFY